MLPGNNITELPRGFRGLKLQPGKFVALDGNPVAASIAKRSHGNIVRDTKGQSIYGQGCYEYVSEYAQNETTGGVRCRIKYECREVGIM